MSFEGIWKVEMHGPYDWEPVSTAIMENGRFFGASADHYSIGHYEEDGDSIKVTTTITQHGESRTIFGVQREVFDARMEATVNNAGEITGKAYSSDSDSFNVNLRLTRLGDLV